MFQYPTKNSEVFLNQKTYIHLTNVTPSRNLALQGEKELFGETQKDVFLRGTIFNTKIIAKFSTPYRWGSHAPIFSRNERSSNSSLKRACIRN